MANRSARGALRESAKGRAIVKRAGEYCWGLGCVRGALGKRCDTTRVSHGLNIFGMSACQEIVDQISAASGATMTLVGAMRYETQQPFNICI